MLGAIVGDIVGSRFEFKNFKSKEFEWFTDESIMTDESYMTVAVAAALLQSKSDYSDLREKTILWLKTVGRKYPDARYSSNFKVWLKQTDFEQGASFSSGGAMRVSPVAGFANSMEEVKMLSKTVTEITHNHPLGLKGAEAVSSAVFLARRGDHKKDIMEYISQNYYEINFNLDSIRDKMLFDDTCEGTVPQAIRAFYESTSFVNAIENAISIGGDSDTIASITGAIAEAYYQAVPKDIAEKVIEKYIDTACLGVINKFYKTDRINRNLIF